MTAPYDDAERAFEAAHWAGLPTMPDDERVVDVDDEDEERER